MDRTRRSSASASINAFKVVVRLGGVRAANKSAARRLPATAVRAGAIHPISFPPFVTIHHFLGSFIDIAADTSRSRNIPLATSPFVANPTPVSHTRRGTRRMRSVRTRTR
tara:strand:+ start:2008 stop:2337 length:330 start_codon:yes stop_codon:yes gene_type:complete